MSGGDDTTLPEDDLSDVAALVEHLVTGVVRRPDDVVVSERMRDREHVVRAKVHSDDNGRVIGRSGRTIRALRTLVGLGHARVGLQDTTVNFDLID